MTPIEKYASFLWITKLGRNQNETYELLLQTFGSTEEAFKVQNDEDIPESIKEFKVLCSRLVDDNLKVQSINEIENAFNKKMKCCCVEDQEYPVNLLNYRARPLMFFYYGDLNRINNATHKLAVVGSRNCSQYGKDVTRRFVDDLKGKDTIIISGLARGIDSTSHKAAVDNGMVTVAVLGCGLNIVYPSENVGLYKRICETGVIISEYVPDTPPFKSYFPARNRIISGLSDAVLVVEAGLGSGALITADLALDDGKDVLAVPNRIDVPCGSGCNSLIKNGAFCVTSSSDLYYCLGIDNDLKDSPDMLTEALNEDQLNVYNIVKTNPQITDEDIAEETGISYIIVKRCLSSLEINGFIRRTSNGGFVC